MASSSELLSTEPNFMSTTFTLLLLLLFLFVLWCRKKGLLKRDLKGLSGPRQYFLGSWLNLWELAKAKDAMSVLRKYCSDAHVGSLLNLGIGPMNLVLLLSPENIQKIFGSGDMNYLVKPKRIAHLLKPVPWYDCVGVSRGEKWRSRRKLITSKLSYSKLLSYLEPMNECSKILVGRLDSLFETESEAPQEIERLLLDTTFRTICKIIFGVENDEEYERFDCDSFISGTARYLQILTDRLTYPWLAVDFLFRLHPKSKELDRFYQQSIAFIGKLVADQEEAHQSGTFKKPSLMKDLVEAGLSLEAIYEEISAVVFGGYDTTGKGLNYLLFMLALNPVHQDRCRREVDGVIATSCPNGEFSGKCLREMVFLEQCILESLRMFPPLGGFMRELEGSVTLEDGITLLAGTIVAVLPITVHMNPKYYPNAERFDPTRFSPEARSGRSPFAYLPFSAGPRGCLGVKYAMNELLVMAARVLRHFEIFTDDKLEELSFRTNWSITAESPIHFVFKKRNLSA